MARPIATAFNLVWERGDRWVIRPAMRYIWLTWAGMLTLVAATAAWSKWRDWESTVIFIIPLMLLAGRAFGSRSWVVDWSARAFVRGDSHCTFAALRAFGLESGRFTSSTKGATTSRQAWYLKILASDDSQIPICWSTSNLRLLRTARHLAAAFDVPLLDQSGPNKLVRAWHPKLGSAPLADCINVSRTIGADIPEPRTPDNAGEEPRTDGVELFWNVGGPSPWYLVLISFTLTLLSIGLTVFVHPAWVLLGVNLAWPMLLISLFVPRDYGRNFVRLTSRHVTLGRPFPLRYTHRVSRAAVEEVRIVERVRFPKAHGMPKPYREEVHLLGDNARLLCRIGVRCGTGLWLALAVERALHGDIFSTNVR